MKPLIITATDNTPSVNFNPQSGILELEGKSYSKDSKEFYAKLLEWVQAYVETNPANTIVNIKIVYLNSGSQKYCIDVLRKLKTLHSSGKQILVKWYYDEDDDIIKETGDDYSRLLDMPFEMVSVPVE